MFYSYIFLCCVLFFYSEEVSCRETAGSDGACPLDSGVSGSLTRIHELNIYLYIHVYNTNNVLHSPSLRAQHDSADSALVALLSVYKQLSPYLVNVPVPMRLKVAHPVHCSFITLAYLILIVLCEVGVVSTD